MGNDVTGTDDCGTNGVGKDVGGTDFGGTEVAAETGDIDGANSVVRDDGGSDDDDGSTGADMDAGCNVVVPDVIRFNLPGRFGLT